MSKPFVFTIPGTPDKCLSPNAVRSERHWGPRHRATKQARSDAYLALRGAIGQYEEWWPTLPLTVHAVIAWEKGRRSLDPDNAHAILKATIDGIADALGINDRDIVLSTVTQDRDADGRGYVKLAIEPADGRKTA